MYKVSILILIICGVVLCRESLQFLDAKVGESDIAIESSELSQCFNDSANFYNFFSNKLKNCGKSAYAYCCAFGTPCDCSKGIISPGQCKRAAYEYCCQVGNKCNCSEPALSSSPKKSDKNDYLELFSKIELLDYATRNVFEQCENKTQLSTEVVEKQNEILEKTKDCIKNETRPKEKHKRKSYDFLKQCKKESYAFCCAVGTPCDCSKGTTAPGQCDTKAYLFCCSVGKKCDCAEPPRSEITPDSISEIKSNAKQIFKRCLDME